MTPKSLMNEHECAIYRSCSVSTIQKERVRGDGPPYIKMGRLVRYRPEDVDQWLAARLTYSTSQLAA